MQENIVGVIDVFGFGMKIIGIGDMEMSEQDILKRLEVLEKFHRETIKDIDYMTQDLDTLMRERTEKVFKATTMLTEELKDQVVREWLTQSLEINESYADELRKIPLHKRQDFNNEDLENNEKVAWACKILLDNTEEPNSEEWKI